jgi:hypothetical protein
MKVLTEEWTKRIPKFWRKAGSKPEWRSGGVAALTKLYLEWPVPAKETSLG